MADLEKLSDIKNEMALLGALLIEPDAIKEVSTLKPTDFYSTAHAWIFQAIQELPEVDSLTVCGKLAERKQLTECGGESFIAQLTNEVPTAMHIKSYARKAQGLAVKRRIVQAVERSAMLCYDSSVSAESAAEMAQKLIHSATTLPNAGRKTQHMRDVMGTFVAGVEELHNDPESRKIVATGFHDLDKMLGGGLGKGELVIVAGRPGMGKTSFMLSMMTHASFETSKRRQRGVIYTLEMVNNELVNRWMSGQTGIDSQRLRAGDLRDDEWQNLMKMASRFSDAEILMNDSPMSIDQIAADAEREHQLHGLDYIAIDFLGLVESPGTNDYEKATAVALGAKNLAKRLEIPVMLGCQLSRAVEQRSDKRPNKSDLRDSGRIEEAADEILMLYRDDYYNPDSDQVNIAEIICDKNRHGPTGSIRLFFDKRLTAFKNLARERIEL